MVSKNKLFIFFSLSLLFGIFLNNIFIIYNDLGWWLHISILVALFFALLFFIYYICAKKFLLFIIAFVLGFLLWICISYYSMYNVFFKGISLEKYFDNSKHDIVIEVQDVYKIKDHNNEYIVKLRGIDGIVMDTNIKSIIVVPSNFDLKKGYIISWSTKLYELENTKEFSYKNYMLSKNIYFKSYISSYEIESIIPLNLVEEQIVKIRNYFLKTIEQIYPREEGIFLGGILIWARENLPKELKTDFNNSGLTHFIAVSGFNITILIVFLTYILRYFPTFVRVGMITIAIGLFTILVWDTAPVVRASIMGLIWYYVLASGREWNILSIVLLTAVIMVWMSPLSLNYDVSLHLSFLAVLWIMYTQEFFAKIFKFLPEVLEIRTAFVLTLSALSFTLPIMIFNFGQVSIMSPFANIAVTWTIPIAMLFGFLSIIVYYVYPFAWIVVGYLTWIFLKWDILVVHFFWKLDWSLLKMDFGIYKNHVEILYFVVLVFLILWFGKKPVVKKEEKI
jgi:competence protein ComEC